MSDIAVNPFEPYELQIKIEERKKLIAMTIKGFRKSKGLQQKEVADLLGISAQTYNGYEKARNEPPVEILVRLSFLYDVSLDLLVQRDVFFIDAQGASEQLAYFNSEIAKMKQELETTALGDNEQMRQLVEGLDKLTQALGNTLQQEKE